MEMLSLGKSPKPKQLSYVNFEYFFRSYTVNDPDGRLRKVTYTADPVNGFQVMWFLASHLMTSIYPDLFILCATLSRSSFDLPLSAQLPFFLIII